MKRLLLRVVGTLAVVLLIYVALLASEWLPPVDSSERAALAVLEAPSPVPDGPDAFPVAWFLFHDLEGRDPQTLMREDAIRLHGETAAGRGDDFEALGGTPADQPTLAVPGYCPPAPASCLETVRALPDHGASMVEPNAVVLGRAEALHATTHLTYPFRLEDPLQLPKLGGLIALMRMDAARRFVEGDRIEGLTLACRQLSTWRRLGPRSDILISAMFAAWGATNSAHLVGEMLAEWPAATPLPGDCDGALAPVVDADRDYCRVWQGEFRYLRLAAHRPYAERRKEAQVDLPWIPSFAGDLLSNARKTEARMASSIATGCGGYAGREWTPPGWLDWTFDPAGTLAAELEDPDEMAPYFDRFADVGDIITAVRLQAHLRDAVDPVAGLTAVPGDLQDLPWTIEIDSVGRAVVVSPRRPGPGQETWILRLPARALPATPAAR